jgi:hypothetical protein
MHHDMRLLPLMLTAMVMQGVHPSPIRNCIKGPLFFPETGNAKIRTENAGVLSFKKSLIRKQLPASRQRILGTDLGVGMMKAVPVRGSDSRDARPSFQETFRSVTGNRFICVLCYWFGDPGAIRGFFFVTNRDQARIISYDQQGRHARIVVTGADA